MDRFRAFSAFGLFSVIRAAPLANFSIMTSSSALGDVENILLVEGIGFLR